jgi:hypothetical protein
MYMSKWNPLRPFYAAMVVLFSGLANLTRQPNLAVVTAINASRRPTRRTPRTTSPITT